MRRLSLVFAVLVSSLSTSAAAAPLQPADRRAHAEATAALRAASTAEHRADWRVELMAEATAVPRRYTVTLLANYVEHAPSVWLMTIDREGERAVAELVDADGVRRGALPAAAVDEWLRTTQHLRRATQTRRGDGIGLTGYRSASHVPYRSVQVLSREPAEPLELVLARGQPIHRELDGASDVQRFAHTWAVRGLEALVRRHLGAATKVAVDEALKAEILARLEPLKGPAGTALDGPWAWANEHDRAASAIYSHLLDVWQYAPAIAAIRRCGFVGRARHLELVTMPEDRRLAALPGLLCGEYELRRQGLALARALGDRAEAPLLTALRCELDEYAAYELVAAVSVLPTTPAVNQGLRALLAADPPGRVRVAIDRWLMTRARDEEARKRLFAAADRPSAAPEHRLPDDQRAALAALVVEADADASRRPAIAAVIRRVLTSIPASAHETYSGMDTLVQDLGELGGPEDLPIFHGLLATQTGSVVVHLIHAVARHDTAAAVAAARREIARYAGGADERASFGWNVGPYLGLLLRADARAAVPGLRRALTRMRRDETVDELQAVIRYLEARGPERTRQVYAFVAATGELDPDVEAALRARHALDEGRLRRAGAEQAAASAAMRPAW